MAYRDGGPWLDQLLAYLDDNHKFTENYIAENMPSVGYNRPEGTYLTWLDMSEIVDAIDAKTWAAEQTANGDTVVAGISGSGFIYFLNLVRQDSERAET